MYRDRLAEPGESKVGARTRVGALLDLNPATLRNWVEDGERAEGSRPPARPGESEEIRELKKRVAELERANEILKTSAAFFTQASSTAGSGDRRLHRGPTAPVRRRADLCGALRARPLDPAIHLLPASQPAGHRG
jgi:transposase-like protein